MNSQFINQSKIKKMRNSKNAIQKNAIAKKNEDAKKLDAINLKEISEKLEFSKMENPKGIREKNSIYIYPIEWKGKEFNKERDSKEFRGMIRRKRDRIINAFIWGNQSQNPELMEKSKNEFLSFYKEFYSKNDFSLNSISEKSESEKISSNLSSKDAKIFLDYLKKLQGK